MSDPPTTPMPTPPGEPRKRRWLLPAAVGVGAVILGLIVVVAGGGDDPEVGAPPAPRPPSPSVTIPVVPPGPGEPTEEAPSEATVEQYASLVARNDGEWRATVADIDEACTDPDAVAICAASYLTAGYKAEVFRLQLSGAHDPECQTKPGCLYLGEVPTEIAALVASAEAAAAEYIAAYQAWSAAGCEDPLDFECGGATTVAMVSGLDGLTQQFDAWKPYTG